MRRRNKTASRPPILLIRGFGEAAPLPHIVRWYRDRGFDFRTMPFSVLNSMDIVRHGREVRRLATELAEDRGAKINLIGYSLGGIVGLYALNCLGLHRIVAKFAAYGSPFQGTPIARLAHLVPPFLPLDWQVTPRSRFLTDLLADRTADQVPKLSVGGRRDLVVPAAATQLPRAKNLLLDCSHSCFMHDTRPHEPIVEFFSS